MALVAYNSSSDSDSDPSDVPVVEEEEEEPQMQNLLFAELPAPKLRDELLEPEMIVEPSEKEISLREKLPSVNNADLQVKKKKKILLPSLHEDDSSDDDDKAEERKQKILSSSKGTFDIFGSLPKPKHSCAKTFGRTLVPHVLTKHADSSKEQTSEPQKMNPLKQSGSSKSAGNANLKTECSNKAFTLLNVDYGSDNEDDNTSNFFSLETENSSNQFVLSTPKNISLAPVVSYCEPKILLPDALNVAGDESQRLTDFAINSADNSLISSTEPMTSPLATDDYMPSYSDSSHPYYETAWHSDDYSKHEYDSTQNSEFTSSDNVQDVSQYKMPSVGQKRRHGQEKEIEVIEVNLADHLNSSSLEFTKNLTIEQNMTSHSKKRNKDMPTSQQKRKHQITYLAHQAKERELELKNQWAENKFSKKQTQSKYGF